MPRKTPPLRPPPDSTMSPASSSLPSSDSRLKWRKRKRESNPKRPKLPQAGSDDDPDSDNDAGAGDDEDELAGYAPADSPSGAGADPVLDLRESEVLSDAGHRISVFPAAVRRAVNRPHPSVLSIVAAERFPRSFSSSHTPFLENISHGQLQALSSVLPDHPSLLQPPELDKPSAYVCIPPPLMEGKGVPKRFSPDQLLLVPMHSDWFSPNTVHRMERQVVPHFFSGKSSDHTPGKYITLRNKIISKYLENSGRRLVFADCQGLVSSNSELYDLSRIVRFLDHWGIINYLATASVHRGLRMAATLLREDAGGELQIVTAPLKSIDSLILFDRPKCSLRTEDVAVLSSSTSSGSMDPDAGLSDLDSRIRERLSEYACSYCSQPLPDLHYQSQKETDIILCTDCFHDAKYITGHSSLDFMRVDSKKDTSDLDGDSWTDQETFLLLEAIEKYNDNWNEIAEHVGTKSKAQCILHFIRLPVEDGLLENIEPPHVAVSSKGQEPVFPCLNSNGDTSGVHLDDIHSGSQLPFANSANPVMSLVAFLASAIGPRVAASCANAALSVLTRTDSRSSSEGMHADVGNHGAHAKNQNDDILPYARRETSSSLPLERVKFAAVCGLSAAAMKGKLFADQEEREIQRLAATIINHQLKRLELKLKQFAEVETLLLKECEQVERMRQRLSAERVRMMSTRLGAAVNTLPAAAATAAAVVNTNTRQPAMPGTVGQTNISPAYGNNMQGHPQMSFMQQQQMLSFGPRLPLSAIHPTPSPSSANAVFNTGMPNTVTSNHHPLLRSASGNNSTIG
ncbi:SWI/SNF complex subunit SWI3C homolog [Typha latifolia]|uniref:SWI/SNF complex subunit SWI3C homolog n=1 Tax=Typha latifolia TaxID=4733 RepID=UPI003C2FE7C5